MQTLAYAKLNLTLDVLFRREDGYHELDMLNLRVSLADTLTFSPADDILVTYEGMDTPPDDTVTKAAGVYSELAGRTLGARIHVSKRIPAEAGLGGGSADAAETLLLMQREYGVLNTEQLYEAARVVGADVPYCLNRKPCRVGGIGEKIEPLPPIKKPLWFLLLNRRRAFPRRSCFRAYSCPYPIPIRGKPYARFWMETFRRWAAHFIMRCSLRRFPCCPKSAHSVRAFRKRGR